MSIPAFTASIILKTRSLIEDFGESDFQVFTYTNSSTWTLQEPNITTITQVLYNGNPLVSGQGFVFNPLNNKITVIGITFTSGDTVEVDYTFNKYSDTEMVGYLRGALTHLSIYDYSTNTYYINADNVIIPDLSDPSNKTGDLIAIITSLLILPDYVHYRMPNLAINYPAHMPREDRIREIIERYKAGIGIVDIIKWNRSPGL